MKMTFRWYGSDFDPIPLKYIRQVPGITGMVGILMDIPARELQPLEKIEALQKEVNDAGLKLEVVENVNVHEDIKLGLPTRDRYIESYRQTLRNLKEISVRVVCHNSMPVLDWTHPDLVKVLPDGSNILSYDQSITDKIADLQKTADEIQKNPGELRMPGQESECMASLKQLFEQYKNTSHEDLFADLEYFLEQIIPVCEECGIKVAIHSDDPPWDISGLPRIATNTEDLKRILGLVDSEYNSPTLCSGPFGSNSDNDAPAVIRRFGNRIHFAHVRSIKIHKRGRLDESSHLSFDGSLGLFKIMRAYYDVSFEGYVRPDHDRTIQDKRGRAGYGSYDRALGITHLNGLWEIIDKMSAK